MSHQSAATLPGAAAAVLGAFVLSMVFEAAKAEPLLTSWRELDEIWYVTGCHDEDAAVHVAEAGAEDEDARWLKMLRQGRCFVLSAPLRARLLRWVAGPYPGLAGEPSISIWLILDQYGDREYVHIPDLGGPHEPAKRA